MEHAWSPTRSAAGRRLRPLIGTEAPSRGGSSRFESGSSRVHVGLGVGGGCWVRHEAARSSRQRLNLVGQIFGFRREEGFLRAIWTCLSEGLRGESFMGHDGLTRSPSGLSERRTGFSPPELGSPTAPVVPPTGAVPCPDSARRVPAPGTGSPPPTGAVPCRSAFAAGHRVVALPTSEPSSTGDHVRGPSSTARRREWPVWPAAVRVSP